VCAFEPISEKRHGRNLSAVDLSPGRTGYVHIPASCIREQLDRIIIKDIVVTPE
jgi:hypothetical protein